MVKTDNDHAILMIRLIIGGVYLSEGIEKFLYPVVRGVGWFERFGFPFPDFVAHSTAIFEISAGLLILLGLFTRLGALVAIIIMTNVIIITKVPIAFGEAFGPFALLETGKWGYGFWPMWHRLHLNLALWLGSLFLIIKGGGGWSADCNLIPKLSRKLKR